MSVRDLEVELGRIRDPKRSEERSNAVRLAQQEALAYRARGNLPDDQGRSLRLVLWVDDEPLGEKRLRYEPDLHAAPSWRRQGSRPINVVPLAFETRAEANEDLPWWEQPDVAPLEAEWRRTGRVGEIAVPADLRGFVLKTIASLRAAGLEVTQQSVLDSVSRWLSPVQVAELRAAFNQLEDT
jgi:hypothetical protein